ncbi:MAG: rhomboid family intramembrane serine protease [Planctomycetaceae bacterium]|jgi:membrane associated rhomboid family serine protease|nr:rhomboid family intramembrane serine protease [Planctomycetaceae bacterium]
MGFYDRDYYRGDSSRREYYHIQTQQSWVFAIIVVNIMIFAANFIRGDNVINNLLMMSSSTLYHPAEWWRLITCAFAHANFQHIFFNMFALFFFGPLVERRYGPTEFLCFYLVTAILASLAWGILNLEKSASMLGASGAISGVVMLVIWNYPRMLVYVFGIIEMPMWLMGAFYIGLDLFGVLGYSGERNIAYAAHLAGTAFGALYAWQKWRFCSIPYFFTSAYWKERARKRKFFHPKDYIDSYNDSDKDDTERTEQVDAILRKISEKGQDSLTWNERRILKRASEEYQKKHKPK